jgi:uncharacterized protein GlcG (DUF336 family)
MNITTTSRQLSLQKIKSEEIGTKMDICVVDAGANLVAFARMDGAWMDLLTFIQKQKHQHGLPWTLPL